ncbi:hypothetical protein [Mycoplasma parvum]|uniref:Uncharacterized protein n=1 Tax=Mycoplasma parvum str. Indiana TaxID=1403316 RepID=U5NFE5_9MOLU|nr:hypothetical protein [Mycoplasma parvum]AGX88859.1 hypothetical protein PRV_00420 [Mycoplasma parvum str. Indiana]
MKSIFNLGLFREYLREDLTSFEYGFIKKVFSQAALGFAAFGAIVSILASVSKFDTHLGGAEAFWGILGIFAIASGLMFMFYYFPKYKNNPLDVRTPFVRNAYISLFFSYGTIFLLLLKGVSYISGGSSDQHANLWVGLSIFGMTLIVYSIPASIGFFMKKHSKAVSLYKFLGFCYSAYLILFLISLIGLIMGSVYEKISGYAHFALLILCGVIIFTSPILSLYRMKTVVRYLDPQDAVVTKKWEVFFVFEILAQLMQMALYISRFVLYYCLGCSRR